MVKLIFFLSVQCKHVWIAAADDVQSDASTIKIVFKPALLYNLISSNACSDLHRLKLPLSICIALGHSLSSSTANVLVRQFTNGMVH